MPESERNVFKEAQTRYRMLDGELTSRDLTCEIDIHGAMHHGRPPQATLGRISESDVVTLELTRNVVREGLEGGRVDLFRRNSYWRRLVSELRRDKEDKRIRGIEVNQTPRVAFKRFTLHYGFTSLALTALNFEIDEDNIPEFEDYLPENEYKTLQNYGWLITESRDALHAIMTILDMSKPKGIPWQLCQELSLVSFNRDEAGKPKPRITLIKTPHLSIDLAASAITSLFEKVGNLTDEEVLHLLYEVLNCYLLAPSELSEAEEIGYVTSQYTRADANSEQTGIKVIHIGGAYHTRVLTDTIKSNLPDGQSSISVSESYDPRVKSYIGTTLAFLRDKIPFENRLEAVKVRGFEVMVDPKLMVAQVEDAVIKDIHDFRRRVEIEREVSARYPDPKSSRDLGAALRMQDRAYLKT